jgi:hypothetical protein
VPGNYKAALSVAEHQITCCPRRRYLFSRARRRPLPRPALTSRFSSLTQHSARTNKRLKITPLPGRKLKRLNYSVQVERFVPPLARSLAIPTKILIMQRARTRFMSSLDRKFSASNNQLLVLFSCILISRVSFSLSHLRKVAA